jgi:hypothetical protein
MNDPGSDPQIIKQYLRGMMVRNTVMATIYLFVQAMIWGALNFVLPDGWVQAVVNILFALFALGTSIMIKQAMDIGRVPGWLGLLVGIVIFLLVIGVFRPIVTEILASIF